ncbi:MAG: DNA polymerase IV [Chloroflexi bacterium]|nr:DNA polymerase IV [Chloroflexota bacterium]
MAKIRKILHLDLDAFFCSVAEQLDPTIKGKAVAVGAKPSERGAVASASYPARSYGIKSAMPMAKALRLCPELIIVRPDPRVCVERSQLVMDILLEEAPKVEPASIDEAFADVTILRDSIDKVAEDIQRRVNTEVNLPCSLGGGTSKLLAKMANAHGKTQQPKDKPPNSIMIVPPGGEKLFLENFPVGKLWGVGSRTEQALEELGVETIGQLAASSIDMLSKRFGKPGRDMWYHANAIDPSPVLPLPIQKSAGRQMTFQSDTKDEVELKHTLRRLSAEVGRQVRQAGLCGRTVTLTLRWADYSTFTRQMTLHYPIDRNDQIYAAAVDLFDRFWLRGELVRLIGVGLSGFGERHHQWGLWEDLKSSKRAADLQAVLDKLWDKYGEKSIRPASDLYYEPAYYMYEHLRGEKYC